MDNSTLKNIFDFLEKEENKKLKERDTFIWKVKLGYPLTKEDLIFKGDLNLYNSNIETLPEGLKVGDYLDLRKTKITSLPEGLEVGSYLDIEDTKITSLPKGLQVGSSLYIDETPLTKYSDDELREMVKPGIIKGRILR